MPKQWKENFDKVYYAVWPMIGNATIRNATMYYDKLSDTDKEQVTLYFIEVFAKKEEYYDVAYLRMAELIGDARLIAPLRAYEKQLKKKKDKAHDLAVCREVIATLTTKNA